MEHRKLPVMFVMLIISLLGSDSRQEKEADEKEGERVGKKATEVGPREEEEEEGRKGEEEGEGRKGEGEGEEEEEEEGEVLGEKEEEKRRIL